MFKKIAIGFLIFVVLLVGTLIALPYFFKDKIFAAVQDAANENVNATVSFGDFGITIFDSFPDLTLSIEDVKVSGIDTFAGIDLAKFEKLHLTVDIKKAIGGKYQVKSFGITKPEVHVKVLADGTANWDIAKPSEEEVEVEEETSSSDSTNIVFQVDEYYIENAHIIYDDLSLATYANLENFTHRGSVDGDVDAERYIVHTVTDADAITVGYEGVKYMRKVETDIKFDIDVDLKNAKYTFKENTVQLNQLILAFDGWVSMPNDDIDMDLTFSTKETSFGSILSMVPGAYTADFADVKAAGSLALSGMAKGIYNETSLPAFDLKMVVNDASVQYPDLPKSIEEIEMDLHISNPDGVEDHTVINLKKFHMAVAENPIDMTLLTKTPMSDPYIEATLQMQMNLETLADVIPVEEGESYTGIITSDIAVKGNQSSIDNEAYEEFDATGQLSMLDFDYKSPDLPYATTIKKAYLNFSPQSVELSAFEMLVGKSDIQASGQIENFIAYYLSDDPLRGTFNMTSNLMDLNEFMEEEEEVAEGGEGSEEEEEPLEVFEVPGNLDFVMSSSIKKLVYDNMDITNVNGGITIRNQTVTLDGLNMNLLGGAMKMSGSYATPNPASPDIDFYMDIDRFDVVQTFETFNTVQKLAPIAKNATGAFSCGTSLIGKLDSKMEADLNSLSGEGQLKTHNVVVKNTNGALAKAGDLMKSDQFETMTLDNVNISFAFEDGRINIEPFDMKLGDDGTSTVSGSHAFAGDLDYVMATEVPSGQYGALANDMISGELSKLNFLGDVGNVIPDRLLFDILIGGTSTDPKVSVKPNGASGSGSATGNVKEKVEEKIEEVKEEVKEKIEDTKAKAKEELAVRKKAIMDEGKKRADNVRAESKKKAAEGKKSAYAEAQKLDDKAKSEKNPIKKAGYKTSAKELRKKADQAEQKAIDQGNQKADNIMKAAQKKADNLK